MTVGMDELQEGVGICTPSHMLVLRTAPEARELGAMPDVISGGLNAVHHANRQGASDERIAAALPGLRIVRGRAVPGSEIVLFGPAIALDRFRGLEGIDRLFRRGMVEPESIQDAYCEAGELGTAFVRNRQAAKRSPGALRRAKARAERRGKAFPEEVPAKAPDPSILALHYGPTVVHLRTLQAQVPAGPLMIGTFGFSQASTPAALPILLDGVNPLGD